MKIPSLTATPPRRLTPYRVSMAGTLLAAREAVMAPIRPMLRDAGITEQQWRVLRVLLDEGPVDPSRLADYALLRAPSLTRILRELAQRELIDRHADAEDGRRSIVVISAAGEDLVNQTAARTMARLDQYAVAFGVERFALLLSELRAFTAIVGDVAAADPE